MKADRASMLASLEVRTPFLQPALAELAASVPTAQHLRKGGKALLREVLRRRLPDGGRPQGKVAFRVPAADWLRGPLQSVIREQIVNSRLYTDGFLDGVEVARAMDAHAAGRQDWTRVLWPTMVLGFWLDGIEGAPTV